MEWLEVQENQEPSNLQRSLRWTFRMVAPSTLAVHAGLEDRGRREGGSGPTVPGNQAVSRQDTRLRAQGPSLEFLLPLLNLEAKVS